MPNSRRHNRKTVHLFVSYHNTDNDDAITDNTLKPLWKLWVTHLAVSAMKFDVSYFHF